MSKCKIVEVQSHATKTMSPIIVGWDHGTLKDSLLSSSVCDIKDSNSSCSVQVTINDNTIYKGEVPDKPMCRTFIAIRSKNREKPLHSKLKLFEACSTLLVEEKQENLDDSKISDFNHAEKFYKVFGSKKGLRQHQTLQKLNIVLGNVRESLQQTLETVKVEETPEVDSTSNQGSGILPPCDRSASNKEDVYNVAHIIPLDLMEELEADAKVIVQMMKSNTALSTDDYSVFFVESIAAISKSTSVKIEPDILMGRIKMLIFSELLIKLSNSRRNVEKNRNFSLADNLPLCNQYILDNYTAVTGGKRMLTIQNQDKILCHVMILVVLSCCYILNLKVLCSSVPFSTDKIAPMLQLVGLTPVPGADKLYVLKTPLPALPTGGGKMRRRLKRKR